jgi:hypothetical protein
MSDEIKLCVHCGEEIRIIPDEAGRLLKCDIKKTAVISENGTLVLGFVHHSERCTKKLTGQKAVNNGSS